MTGEEFCLETRLSFENDTRLFLSKYRNRCWSTDDKDMFIRSFCNVFIKQRLSYNIQISNFQHTQNLIDYIIATRRIFRIFLYTTFTDCDNIRYCSAMQFIEFKRPEMKNERDVVMKSFDWTIPFENYINKTSQAGKITIITQTTARFRANNNLSKVSNGPTKSV